METIMVIEDDRETVSLLRETLVELGYRVEVCVDGSEGLKRIRESAPDLVICDVLMPGLSGFELLERLASEPAGAPPFVFVTALGDRNNEVMGRRLGADDYLTKPIDFEILSIVIENRLRRRPKERTVESDVHLTDREREVLTWVGRGKTSYEIGVILGVRERTVNFHCDQAMKRLNVLNRTQAVAKAIAVGLIGT
jgi:DNA-binding NarL/FixJ family response regulator